MKLITLLVLCLVTALTSCNGQHTFHVANKSVNDQHSGIALGDTVKELGNNIMIIYQDKKNN